MKVAIVITVDVADPELVVDYTASPNSLTTEYGGNVSTEDWTDVEITGITYNGYEAELLSFEEERDLINHILEGLE